MRTHSLAAYLAFIAATNSQEVTTTTTVESTVSGVTDTTTAIAIVDSTQVPIVEIVVVGVGVLLLVFAAFKMSSLVRQYSTAGSNVSMLFLPPKKQCDRA